MRLGNGNWLDARSFCQSLDTVNGLGWILQEPLRAHPDIARICGDKISGVRTHSFLGAAWPAIHRAIWKTSIGHKDSDNFHHGASGNMLAKLHPETGEVLRVIACIGFAQRVDPPHPATGATLRRFVVPHWDQVCSLALDAALAFPGYICPGWDIAVCADGPRFLEVNSLGDIDLSQHAHRRGFIDQQFLALMRSRGLERLLVGLPGKTRRSDISARFGSRRKLHWNW